MKEISSFQLDLSKTLTTKEITSLYHYVSSSDHDVYVYQNGQIADAGNFPKLVSFFLLTKSKEPFVIIIDGENPSDIFRDIKYLITPYVKRSVIRKRHQAEEGMSVLI